MDIYINIYSNIYTYTIHIHAHPERENFHIYIRSFGRFIRSFVWRSLHMYRYIILYECIFVVVFLLLIIIWIRVRVNELRHTVYRVCVCIVWICDLLLFSSLALKFIYLFVVVVCITRGFACMQPFSFYHTIFNSTCIHIYVFYLFLSYRQPHNKMYIRTYSYIHTHEHTCEQIHINNIISFEVCLGFVIFISFHFIYAIFTLFFLILFCSLLLF